MSYQIKRINSKGEENLVRDYPTKRKAMNAMDRIQEASSRRSTITLYEDGNVVETREGLV